MLTASGCAFAQLSYERLRTNAPLLLDGESRPTSFIGGLMQETSPTLMFGVALSWREATSRLSAADSFSQKEASIALLARYRNGPVLIRGLLSTGYTDSVARRSSLLEPSVSLTASYNTPFVAVAMEGEYWIGEGSRTAIATRIGFDTGRYWRDGFLEQGGALDQFRADAGRMLSARSHLGLVARWGIPTSKSLATLEPTVSWTYQLGDVSNSVTGVYTLQPDVPIRGGSQSIGRNSLSAGLAAVLPLSPSATLRAEYQINTNQQQTNQAVSLRLTKAW